MASYAAIGVIDLTFLGSLSCAIASSFRPKTFHQRKVNQNLTLKRSAHP